MLFRSLINLNDKYEDLLKSGYDSTAAFHIAISGIGDIDELFQACRDSEDTTFQQESVSSGNDTSINAIGKKILLMPTWVVVLLLVLFAFTVVVSVAFIPPLTKVALVYSAACIGLIVYLLIISLQNGNNTASLPDEPTMPPDDDAWQSSAFTNKRLTAGVLAILLGVFGVHKFYLGFRNAGLIMLCATILSFFALAPVAAILSLVEGIVYLTKSNQEFYRDYYVQKRAWF